ncbi:MAG TPA: DNA repair protein RecN [Longimicrobiales bacterium]|nr:DNA repair protein RecN [Longimicrobiales bacterium]
MLIELRIENFAVIERLSVRLDRGLNVLTGETGAGKSIIVGALALLLGERASAEAVRAGAERAVVEGVFDVAGREDIRALLRQQGLETEDGLLILRREVAVEGRNRAWVNGSASTAGVVGVLGSRLVDLHGQHEHQALLRTDAQRDILDAYAGHGPTVERLGAAHAALRQAREELETLDARRREVEQRADFLRFQLQEIEAAAVEPDEEPGLEEESRRLAHAEDLARLSEGLHHALYEADRSVTAVLGELRRDLDALIAIDRAQESAREMLEAAYYTVEELGRRMGDYASRIEHDPARLDAIQRRQDLLYRLKHKYGPALADVAETGRRAREELDLLEGPGFERKALEKREAEARTELERLAATVSGGRREAAGRLAREVMEVLPQLGLTGGRFTVGLEPLPEPGPNGAERVEFLVAVNAGFEPKALARVASGGELSRVMLALKTILARVDHVPTLVFDEIDAGIGGRVAVQVGGKLREVAGHHQVFAITHLPQIASRADHHLLVRKTESAAVTTTSLEELAGENRVRELARMLGGDPESDTSLDHARELLAAG